MPELPEVETIRRDLAPLVTGRRIVGVEVDRGTIERLAGVPIEGLRAALVGRRIEGLGRRGKYLLFALDDGQTLAMHLRMTGRLVWREGPAPAEAFERAKLVLDGEAELRWSDLRKFGTWCVVEDQAAVTARLGPEPIDPEFSARTLRALLTGRTAPAKAVLLDQRRLAGLGNIYVDEALFEAGVRPDAPAGALSAAAVRRLAEATRAVLERGIANRGASFRDYVDGQGNPGQQHMYVQVFRRQGQPCYRCGTTIARTVVAGRGTHYCPRCQRLPRKRAEARRSG
ncbi:MAG: bifunctional DNA-formamidopyrimidine glycosylase/DNA-(apurinic or apyrimidinic site) lyase [Gemmataceae bacterium]|nr:bifunctional DNA-formamidopyrimidine glycosylase/DNA-(apurinic or apyrimidinic site) lyase [Gemmataceae bacterium]